MKLEWLNTSVVVAAREHNPTILHPAFLVAQKIVPADWELAHDPVCTPAFATAGYRNGVSFAVESTRFQVTEPLPPDAPEQSKAAGLASAYLKALPHVRYTEVEIRLQAYIGYEQDPAGVLINRFLQPNRGLIGDMKPDSLGIRFEYTVDRALLDLFLDAGIVERDGTDRAAVIISGHYSSTLEGEQPLPQALGLLGLWRERCTHLAAAIRAIMGLEADK